MVLLWAFSFPCLPRIEPFQRVAPNPLEIFSLPAGRLARKSFGRGAGRSRSSMPHRSARTCARDEKEHTTNKAEREEDSG